MAFRFKAGESVAKGVKRMAREQIEKALVRLTSAAGETADEAVHDARRRIKRVRALLRLVRKGLGRKAYDRENASLRDASRPLGSARDARVIVDTFDELTTQCVPPLSAQALAEVRRALLSHQEALRRRALGEQDVLAKVVATLKAARQRVKKWTITGKGWRRLGSGLRQVYRTGRKAFVRVLAEPTPENLHEWRKRVKHLWYQLQVLQPMKPVAMGRLVKQAADLGDRLGEDHDLVVLRQLLTEHPRRFGGRPGAGKLLPLIDRRRRELQQMAIVLGELVYRDSPKEFIDRLKKWWRAWR